MILVTGATGLLGSGLIFNLAQQGKKVRALKRHTSNMSRVNRYFDPYPDLMNQIEWVIGDVAGYDTIDDNLDGITHVYHCAGKVSFHDADNNLMLHDNILGTANLVNACLIRPEIRLCHVSSVAALGRSSQGEKIDENSMWKQSPYNSVYAVSKFSSEREVWRGVAEGLNAVIINPSIIVGPGNWKTDSSMMFTRIWKGLKFYTDGVTGFVGLDDVITCMTQLMNSDVTGQRYIISSQNVSFKEFFEKISQQLNKPAPSIHAGKILSELAWRMELIKGYITNKKPAITRENAISASKISYYDSSKIKQQLNIDFKSIDDMVSDTAKIFLKEHEH
jgi:nucleoside-diphosphate-sugar epimerase